MSKRKSELPPSCDEHDEDKRTRHAPVGELEGAAALSRPALSRTALSRPAASTPLYDDVLAVVFSFLTFVELSRVCVCRAWRHAAIRMSCREDSVCLPVPSTADACQPEHFPLARKHIRKWHQAFKHNKVVNEGMLQALTTFLPRLDELHLRLHVALRSFHPAVPQLFAVGIRSLDLRILTPSERWSWPAGIQLMQTIGMMSKLASLKLVIDRHGFTGSNIIKGPAAFFVPLRALPDLIRLTLGFDHFGKDGDWTEDAIDVLRELASLTELTMPLDNLRHFFRTPHSLKLCTIDPGWMHLIADTAWIESLQQLTELHLTDRYDNRLDFKDPMFLTRISGLRTLRIRYCYRTYERYCLLSLATSLEQCPALTSLAVDHAKFNGNTLQRMMMKPNPSKSSATDTPHIPTKALALLTSLTIYVRVDDTADSVFRFLSYVPLFGAQLQHLTVQFCGDVSIPIDEYQHLFALRVLRTFVVRANRTNQMPEDLRESFTPFSPAFRADCFPHLSTFDFQFSEYAMMQSGR